MEHPPLPTRAESELSVVYLASHQSPEGKWDFVQRKLEPLSTIAGDSNIPGHPVRMVIVDACYAAAFRRDPVWDSAWQSSFLFAADADEETQELNFRSPQPVDLGRRYPAATAWLNQHMGKGWDGKLSFLGFVWVQTFVTSKGVPVSQDGWREFWGDVASRLPGSFGRTPTGDWPPASHLLRCPRGEFQSVSVGSEDGRPGGAQDTRWMASASSLALCRRLWFLVGTMNSQRFILAFLALLFGGCAKMAFRRVPVEVAPVRSAEFREKLASVAMARWTGGNAVRTLENGDNFFPSMLSAAASAKRSITFSCYTAGATARRWPISAECSPGVRGLASKST